MSTELPRSEKNLPPQTRDEICSICQDELGTARKWSCGQCKVQYHLVCMAAAKGDGLTNTGAIKRKHGSDGERIPIKCCTCNTTYAQLEETIKQPVTAPRGIVCRKCRTTIPHGERAHRCGNFQEYCSAWWHQSCSQETCQGCGDNIWRAIRRRSEARQR